MKTLLQRFKTSTRVKNIGNFAVVLSFFGMTGFLVSLLIPLVFDLPKIKAAQAERIEAADLEAKKELECLLSNRQWKHVNRHGFVCIPK